MSINGPSQNMRPAAPDFASQSRRPGKTDDPTTVAQQRIAARLDADGDGKLTVAELSAIEKQGQGKNGRPAQALFAALEAPAAGKPILPEPPAGGRFGPKTLDALIAQQEAGAGGGLAEHLVAAIDQDDDGAFTLTELKDALPGKSGYAEGRGAQAERAFDRLDADKDGKVSIDELTAALKRPIHGEEPVETPPAAPELATNEVIDPAPTEPLSGA